MNRDNLVNIEDNRLLEESFGQEEEKESSMPEEKEPINITDTSRDFGKLVPAFTGNKEIFLLAGELDPTFYKNFITSYKSSFTNSVLNVIAGPYIAIEDTSFLKYHDVRNNRLENWWFAKKEGNWWEAHPVFEEAYKNDKIKINIIKRRYPRHFCIGNETQNIYIEDHHDELEKSGGYLFPQNARLTKKYYERWHAIKKHYCYAWNKQEPERTLFKPVCVFEKEKAWKKKIMEEFPEPLKK